MINYRGKRINKQVDYTQDTLTAVLVDLFRGNIPKDRCSCE